MAQTGHEFSAKNVELAIEEGLRHLNLGRDEVEIEVLHEGSRGILGIGATDARIRIVRRLPATTPASSTAEALDEESHQHESDATHSAGAAADAADPAIEADFDRVGQAETTSTRQESPSSDEAAPDDDLSDEEYDEDDFEDDDELDDDELDDDELDDDELDDDELDDDEFDDFDDLEESETADIAYGILAQMLDLMNIDAQIETSLELQEDEEDATIHLNIVGADESSLIGRRGETIASIQYLIRLMVNQKLHRWTNIVVDVDGYKEKRAEKLAQMAMRMAEQVVETGRPVTLEPMPASERRLIHIALRDHPQVYTESTGQDERRKVSILLK